jgi:putative tryptophan/tyrosine transport system substrate-binding protein
MRRRKFIAFLGGAAVAWPRAARAQQPSMPVIGLLGSSERDPHYAAFQEALAEGGYVEGRTVNIEYRWAEGHVERYAELVADLVRRQVTVIASLGGIPAALAAKAATTTIPIVFQGGFNPVEIGLVASLSRPGGNVTGATNLGLELGPKRLEVVHELIPSASVFALLINPEHPNAGSQSREMQSAAHALGLQIRIVHARSERDFDAAFAGVAEVGAGGLVIGIGQPFTTLGGQLGALAARHAVPAIFESREFVARGGLASYAGDRRDAFRLAGIYVARILHGEAPRDLPIQQSTKIELILNLKAARMLGVTVPFPLLARAEEVIERSERRGRFK